MFKRKKQQAPDNSKTDQLEVFKSENKRPLAKVILNGYNIESKDAMGRHGAMCSFKIVDGDLWDEWNAQTHLVLRTNEGKEATIKVTALPAESDSYGLIEFI
jgi:hypothetical protein